MNLICPACNKVHEKRDRDALRNALVIVKSSCAVECIELLFACIPYEFISEREMVQNGN